MGSGSSKKKCLVHICPERHAMNGSAIFRLSSHDFTHTVLNCNRRYTTLTVRGGISSIFFFHSSEELKRATPTILKGYKREKTQAPVGFNHPVTHQTEKTQNETKDKVEVKENDDKSKVKDTGTSKVKVMDTSVDKDSNTSADNGNNPVPEVKEDDDPDFIKCIYGYCKARWPIRCYGKLSFNVNAYHGGCTSLYFCSCSFGGKGEETNAELMLLRSGFDCHHVERKSIFKTKDGHFGAENVHTIDEEGMFVADCLFGNNNLMILSNDNRHGNLRNGVFLEGAKTDDPVLLPLNVNGNGLTMLLCSGGDKENFYSAIYMIKSGFKDNKFKAVLLSGDDKFKFSLGEDQLITVSGVEGSRFGMFNNVDNLVSKPPHAYVSQTQSLEGTKSELLMENLTEHASLVVLCSNSNGTENSTVATVYHVVMKNGTVSDSKELSGCHGDSYDKSDLWKFEASKGQLRVSGPEGPCRYAVMSNVKATREQLLASVNQSSCLASGEPTKTIGNVKVTMDDVTGDVSKMSDIYIMLDHKIVHIIPFKELGKDGVGYTFAYRWRPEEQKVGYYMVRVFAVRKHVESGEDVFIELSGSPHSLTRQKPGVVYALNCGGPAYQALTDVVYSSEHKQFAAFTEGKRCKASGGIKHQARLYASMLESHDGFLHVLARATCTESENESLFNYSVDVPNGDYTLRLHHVNIPKMIRVNDVDIGEKIRQAINKTTQPSDLTGAKCYTADVDISITNNKLEVYSSTGSIYKHMDYVAAFALLDKSYKDPSISESDKKSEYEEKMKLADTVLPLTTTITRKELTIVGWSQNLLQNASGEMELKHWNTGGAIKTSDGGYTTEKMFVTSHMWCSKYQEVRLLDHFTAEHLDTSPDIQVMEMYREGSTGGGFYCFTAQLMTEEGKVVKEYTTGDVGSVYKNNEWQEASVTFKGYGPGVRIVAMTSKGKDDKYWAGHYGVLMSNAEIRVRNESIAAEGDTYTDIQHTQGDDSSEKSSQEKLVTQILTDNQVLLEQFVHDEVIPVDAEFEKQTQMSAGDHPITRKEMKKRRKQQKKREIRVFVSSTFRDFSKEREEIIKKAFREINRMCTDRGVFFTYVDLRWGITSEQTSDGKTISICLQEIDRCRPYFICLMGDRFGWCQRKDKIDEVLNSTFDYAIENNPKLEWIDNYRFDSSVTQLEVFHGVLNDPSAVNDKCFFYMRNPPNKDNYTEAEFKRLMSESEWHHEQQEWLKQQVLKHHELKVTRFDTALEVAELIKQDLERAIDADFPEGTELTKLEQQREAHLAFASARCRVYIGRQNYFTTINEYRSKNITQPFVLLGESGSGKSALVANWAKRIEDGEPDTFSFVHFIGSSADSADYIKLIRRLFEEMKIHFQFDMQIPSSESLLVNDLGKWLRMAGAMSKVVLVFDALNQLDDGTGVSGTEHDLQWLPSSIPPNVFLLLSTLPGRAMTACIEKGWPSMKVEPLEDSQKMEIITDYFEGVYGKTLTTEQKEMVVSVKQTSNPLYLKSLLDEIRMYGSFRTLTDKIRDYLSAETPGDLFAKILERLEQDFESGSSARKNLVCDATTALWCSNKGMSEAELTELLDVPSAVWSPFYLSLYENLVNRNGLLNFFHDHLRQAVEKKYLCTPEAKKLCYHRLADYHSGRETSTRTVEELPFLLTRAGELDRLKATVTDLDVFYRLSDHEDGIFELVKAWKTLGDFSLAEEAYMSELAKIPKQTIMKNATYYCKLYSHLGQFYLTLGLIEAAKKIYKTLIKQLEQNYGESHGTIVYSAFNQSWEYRCKHPDVIKSLQELGSVYTRLGDMDKALKVYNDAICRQNRIETPTQKLQLCEGLLGMASVYINKADMAEAKKLMTRALELATFVLGKKHHFVAAIFTQLGQLSYKQGRIDEALAYYMQDLKVTRSEVGTNHPRTATVLNEIALVYDDKNDKMAGQLYEAALTIILETYGPNYLGTGVIRYNLGAFYLGANYFAKAKYQLTESYRLHVAFLGDGHAETKEVKQALDNVSGMTELGQE